MVKNRKVKNQIIFLCILGIFVWLLNLFFHPDFFNSPDAAIYSGVARNIIQGKGATVDSTLPLFLTYYPPSPGPWPSPYPLLFPLTIALSFLIFGVSEFSSVLVSGFFFIATLPFIYLLAKKFFNQKVAILSSLWYIFNPSLLNFSISGMTESLFIFLITSSVYLFFLERDISLFLSGVLIALSALTRFQGVLFLPIIIGFVWIRKKQSLPLIYLLIGFLLTMIFSKLLLPPIAQDYTQLTNHHLWTAISVNSIFSSGEVARVLEPITIQLILANLDLLFKKIISNFYYLVQGLLTATLPSLVVLYILSFFIPLSKKVQQFKLLSISLLLIFALFHLITIFDFRYLHPLLPLIIILAAGTFHAFLEKFNPKKLFQYTAIFTFLFIIIPTFTSPGWGTSIQRSLAKPRKPTILYLLAKIVEENTPEDAIIATDRPAHITWYGKRKSIAIPIKIEDLVELDKKLPVEALFLSSYHSENYPRWQHLVENPHDFGDFYFAKAFEIKPEENYYRIPVKAVLYFKSTKE